MTVTFEEQRAYNAKLRAYNNAVAANNKHRAAINSLNAEITVLQQKVERLNIAKTNINTQNGELAAAITPIEKAPNYESFQGKNENNYWVNHKTHVKDEVYKFLNGVNSIIQQITKKINELQNNIAEKQRSVRSHSNRITNPIKPTEPK